MTSCFSHVKSSSIVYASNACALSMIAGVKRTDFVFVVAASGAYAKATKGLPSSIMAAYSSPRGPPGDSHRLRSTRIIGDCPRNTPGTPRGVQEHDQEEVLDELVEALGDDAPPTGEVTDARAKVQLFNAAAMTVWRLIRHAIHQYDGKHLLAKLISQHEAQVREAAFTRLTMPTVSECFEGIESRLAELAENLQQQEATAVAVRALIEMVAAEAPAGVRKASLDDYDRLVALADGLINLAFTSDELHFDLADLRISILPSGRIGITGSDGGVDKRDVLLPFRLAKTRERHDWAVDAFDRIAGPREASGEPASPPDEELDAAFKAEFGLPLSTIGEFLVCISRIGRFQATAAPSMQRVALVEAVSTELEITAEEAEAAIEVLSLQRRDRWDEPPPGFDKVDTWPWRFSRRLSYIRRPLVIVPAPGGDSTVYWGTRHIYQVGLVLISHTLSGRYKVTSPEMRQLIGKTLDEEGHAFRKEVSKWFEGTLTWDVFSEVSIAPDGPLKAETNLGDVDVMLIDRGSRRLFAIECKHLVIARTPYEIYGEVRKLLEGNPSLVERHVRRHEWLTENVVKLKAAYSLDSERWTIVSLIVTSEQIPTTYVKTIPLPVLPFTRLRREGSGVLDSLPTQ